MKQISRITRGLPEPVYAVCVQCSMKSRFKEEILY